MSECQSCGVDFEPLGAWHKVCRDCFREAKRQETAELQAEIDALRRTNRNLTARLRQVEPRVQELQNLLREAELAMETFDEVFVRELLQLAHPDKHNDSPLARRVTQRLLAMRGAR